MKKILLIVTEEDGIVVTHTPTGTAGNGEQVWERKELAKGLDRPFVIETGLDRHVVITTDD